MRLINIHYERENQLSSMASLSLLLNYRGRVYDKELQMTSHLMRSIRALCAHPLVSGVLCKQLMVQNLPNGKHRIVDYPCDERLQCHMEHRFIRYYNKHSDNSGFIE